MDFSTRNDCFTWIEDLLDPNVTTTLDELNYFFLRRNLGGIIFMSIIMFFGFFGNISVIWIYATKFSFTNFRTYTLWLACLDLVNCCLGIPFLLVYVTHYLMFPDGTLCKTGRFVNVFSANASAFLLVVIAVDRYFNICTSRQNFLSRNQTVMICFVAAGVGALMSIPAIILYGNHTFDNLPVHINTTAVRCWEEDQFKGQNYLDYFYIFLSVFSFLVTLVLFIIYSLILRFVCKNTDSLNAGHTKKVTVILFSVTFAYVISALPHYVIDVVLLSNPDYQCGLTFTEGFVFYIVAWSNLVNNAVNPLIYGYSDAKFRRELKGVFINICGNSNAEYTSLSNTSVERYCIDRK